MIFLKHENKMSEKDIRRTKLMKWYFYIYHIWGLHES